MMETEKWLIDGKALVENFRRTKMDEVFPNWKELSPTTQAAIIRLTTKYRAIILSAPIVDAVPVVRGRLVVGFDGSYMCSECHKVYRYGVGNYCTNCGAKLGCDEIG